MAARDDSVLVIDDGSEVQSISEDAEDVAVVMRLPPELRLPANPTEDQKSEFVGRVARMVSQIVDDHPEGCQFEYKVLPLPVEATPTSHRSKAKGKPSSAFQRFFSKSSSSATKVQPSPKTPSRSKELASRSKGSSGRVKESPSGTLNQFGFVPVTPRPLGSSSAVSQPMSAPESTGSRRGPPPATWTGPPQLPGSNFSPQVPPGSRQQAGLLDHDGTIRGYIDSTMVDYATGQRAPGEFLFDQPPGQQFQLARQSIESARSGNIVNLTKAQNDQVVSPPAGQGGSVRSARSARSNRDSQRSAQQTSSAKGSQGRASRKATAPE